MRDPRSFLETQADRLEELHGDGLTGPRPRRIADWFGDWDPFAVLTVSLLALVGIAAAVIL